jgi:hypothetical protein
MRGADPPRIKQRAGHAIVSTTGAYSCEAENLGRASASRSRLVRQTALAAPSWTIGPAKGQGEAGVYASSL